MKDGKVCATSSRDGKPFLQVLLSDHVEFLQMRLMDGVNRQMISHRGKEIPLVHSEFIFTSHQATVKILELLRENVGKDFVVVFSRVFEGEC